MSNSIRLLAMIAMLGLVVGACDDGTTPEGIGNDVEPQVITGGGTADGPIDGRLNVTALDDETGDPLAGAFVMLGPGPDPEFSGTTDADGLITFRNSAIKGEQQLTVLKADYPVSQMHGLNAANLTLSMGEEDESSAAPDTATITGTITGLDSLPVPPQGSFRVGIAGYTIPGLFDEDFEMVEQPEPGPGELPGNMVSPDAGGDNTYELKTWVGRQAIYLLAGTITPGQGGEDTVFDITHFDIVRNVVTTKDETLADVDLATDIALDQASTVAVGGVPAGTNRTNVIPILDLGEDGQIMIQSFTDEDDDSTFEGMLPELTGDLDDGSYLLVAQAYNEVCTGEGDERKCEEEPPTTLAVERDLAAADMTTAAIELMPPAGNLVVDTGSWTFSFSNPTGAELLMADIEDETTEDRVYNVTILNGSASEFTLTQFPAEAGFAGLSGDLLWSQNAAVFVPGTDPNDIAFDDFQDLLLKMSGHEKSFTAQ